MFLVERAVQERQQKVVQAEGEAEAAAMISFTQCCQFAGLFQNQDLTLGVVTLTMTKAHFC